jgi:hypothetical protein
LTGIVGSDRRPKSIVTLFEADKNMVHCSIKSTNNTANTSFWNLKADFECYKYFEIDKGGKNNVSRMRNKLVTNKSVQRIFWMLYWLKTTKLDCYRLYEEIILANQEEESRFKISNF